MEGCAASMNKNALLFIKHAACDPDCRDFDQISDFYKYKFYSVNEVTFAAMNAGLEIEKIEPTTYAEWDFDFVEKFKQHASEKCFVDHNHPNYDKLKFFDFTFKLGDNGKRN